MLKSDCTLKGLEGPSWRRPRGTSKASTQSGVESGFKRTTAASPAASWEGLEPSTTPGFADLGDVGEVEGGRIDMDWW
jgi:hypothetical protein